MSTRYKHVTAKYNIIAWRVIIKLSVKCFMFRKISKTSVSADAYGTHKWWVFVVFPYRTTYTYENNKTNKIERVCLRGFLRSCRDFLENFQIIRKATFSEHNIIRVPISRLCTAEAHIAMLNDHALILLLYYTYVILSYCSEEKNTYKHLIW